MAKPSKRLFAVLSLFVLLQQFSPAFTADLSRHRINHSKKKKTDQAKDRDENNNQEIQESSEKRSARNKVLGTVLRKFWKLIGKDTVIKKINIVADVTSTITSAASIGITVTKAISGCTAIAPALTENWDKYQKLDEEFRTLSTTIDQINLQAETRHDYYINSSFYEYRRTRDKLQEIANEKERIFNSLGPEVLVSAKNASFEIEQLVKEKNATGEEIKDTEIYLGYKEALDHALESLFPSLGLAFKGIKYFWKLYLRDTVIGKKISGLPETIKNTIVSSLSSSDPTKPSLGQRIKASRIMNTRFGKGLQAIGNSVKSKLVKAAKVVKSIGKRLLPLANLAGAAFGIWNVFSQIKECTDMAENSRESVEKMTEMVDKTKEILKSVEESNDEIQSAFDEINGFSFDQILLDAISDLLKMMSDPAIVRETDNRQEIIDGLQAYINGKDIDSKQDNNKLIINNLQRNLNDALHSIPFTLQCYTIKGQFYNSVKRDCAEGRGSMQNIYERVKSLKGIDESSNNCAERTGELFPPLADVTASWEKWASEKQTYNKICLMNDDWVVDNVITQLQNGMDDPKKIAAAIGKDQDAEDEIKAMIDILKDDPRVNQVPPHKQPMICYLRDQMNFKAAAALPILNSNPQDKPVTEEQYNNLVCPAGSDASSDSKKFAIKRLKLKRNCETTGDEKP